MKLAAVVALSSVPVTKLFTYQETKKCTEWAVFDRKVILKQLCTKYSKKSYNPTTLHSYAMFTIIRINYTIL